MMLRAEQAEGRQVIERAFLGVLAAAAILAVWPLLSIAISKSSGWASLAREFRYPGEFTGSKWRWQTATIRRWSLYDGCLTVGAGAEGRYLDVATWRSCCAPVIRRC